MNRILLFALCLCSPLTMKAQIWTVNTTGGITWKWDGKAHNDHIEMSGKRMSVVLRYGINEAGNFTLDRGMVWPMLRTVPNNTHASLMRRITWNPLEAVMINGRKIELAKEKTETVELDGTMKTHSQVGSIELRRTITPSTELPGLIEIYSLKNTGKQNVSIDIPEQAFQMLTAKEKGVAGSYTITMTTANTGLRTVAPGDSTTFSTLLAAYRQDEQRATWDAQEELSKRQKLLSQLAENLVLKTPDETLNRMFAFSKIRACESIYATKGGPMHGPGGESYYAAIWANDQAEYANPFFPYVGYDYANASAVNSFRHFARFMNEQWSPIPSSIIAEGDDVWAGAGDRGDAAMIAYGASRYALASGSKEEAAQLWSLIEWCLEYCDRKRNEQGIVASDRDELEGRFPAGKANLCTSSLYYDALRSAAFLAKDLGKPASVSSSYLRQAEALRKAIDSYFAAKVEGFDTYAYYEGNDILRSWICIPLTVGIYERAKGTIEALFSPRLWTDNGLLTQAGSTTFWDRSTLYALRGVLQAGETEKAMKFLQAYSKTRLLGEHVPYAIEAWPEGSQRHLSAESALYARIMTEGLFGIRPTGLRSFDISPRLPQEWNEMTLEHVRICGSDFNLRVFRKNNNVYVEMSRQGHKTIRKQVKGTSAVSIKL